MRIKYGHLKKRGTKWYIIFREDGRQKWLSTGQTTRPKAEEFRKEHMNIVNSKDREAELRRAADTLAENRNAYKTKSIRIEEIWKLFDESTFRREITPRTYTLYKQIWMHFFQWITQNHPNLKSIYQITDTLAEDYFKALSNTVGNSTYNIHVRIMSYIIKVLSKRTKLENHFARIPQKRHIAESRRELSQAEIRQLLDTTEGWIRKLFVIGIYTGLRLGDCCNLKWSSINRNILIVMPIKTRRTQKLVHIPIHPQLQKTFDEIPHKSEFILPDAEEKYRKKSIYKAIGPVFATIANNRRPPKPEETIKAQITLVSFHSLRHTFVSICKNAGVPDAVVMSIVGHGNSAMTRHYTHIGDDSARDAISKIPAVGTDLVQQAERSKEEIIRLIEQMTPDTWQEIRRTIIGK